MRESDKGENMEKRILTKRGQVIVFSNDAIPIPSKPGYGIAPNGEVYNKHGKLVKSRGSRTRYVMLTGEYCRIEDLAAEIFGV